MSVSSSASGNKVYISSREARLMKIFMNEQKIPYRNEGEFSFSVHIKRLPILVEFASRLDVKFYVEMLSPDEDSNFYFECSKCNGYSGYVSRNGLRDNSYGSLASSSNIPESFYLPDEVVKIAKRLFIKGNKYFSERFPDDGTLFPFPLNYSFRNGEDYYYGFYLPFQFFEGVPIEEREKKAVEFLSDLTKEEKFVRYRLSNEDFTSMTGYLIISNPQSYDHILPNEIDELGGIDTLSSPERSVKMIVRRVPINDKASMVVLSDDANHMIGSSVAPISENIVDTFRNRFGKKFKCFRCSRVERVSPNEYWLTVTEFVTNENEDEDNEENEKQSDNNDNINNTNERDEEEKSLSKQENYIIRKKNSSFSSKRVVKPYQ